jgi:hypothetical protein
MKRWPASTFLRSNAEMELNFYAEYIVMQSNLRKAV